MNKITHIARTFQNAGGEAFLVGGCVRDILLNRNPKDFDFEIYDLAAEKVLEICQNLGKTDLVGEQFGIIKLTIEGETFDIALPRTEKLGTDRGHRNFIVDANPFLDKISACKRRDFTVNAMMLNPLTNEILDFFGGKNDLNNKIIRHVDDSTFIEDSLRVLRAVQFAARFDFSIAESTLDLCDSIDVTDLPAERLQEELYKLLLAKHVTTGLKYFQQLDLAEKLFGLKINICFGSILYAAAIKKNCAGYYDSNNHIDKQLTLMLATMLATMLHRLSSSEISIIFDRLKIYTLNGFDLRKQVLLLVKHQDKPLTMPRLRKNFLHLANTGVDMCLLGMLATATSVENPIGYSSESFFDNYNDFDIVLDGDKVKRILMGKHLLELGYKPGPQMGKILDFVFQKQLDDEVHSLTDALSIVHIYESLL